MIRLHLIVAFLALSLGSVSCRKAAPVASDKPAAVPSESATKSPSTAATATAPEPIRKLLGRWVRADGGYVLELRSADLSGVMEAAYFNPNPIRVSRAAWMQGAAGFQILVELNDVGYPGATYVLSPDPSSDRLVGTYTQPAMQQSFDIAFTRQGR